MQPAFNLTDDLNRGAGQLVRDVRRTMLLNPREAFFLLRQLGRQRAMTARRMAHEARGRHIPVFLIASITNACNLYCKGCYARANGQCGTRDDSPILTAKAWGGIFDQAAEAGIGFILLAGGEPMMRPDVLSEAARRDDVLFPIFTNGTMIDPAMLALLARHRNLVPVLSMEGGEASTDARRGQGAYRRVQGAMAALAAKKLLYGASVTVTTENRAEVMSPAFVRGLRKQGCRLVFYIEYVPVAPGTEYLAPDDAERERIDAALDALRANIGGMVLLSFPGDEKRMGGCLAAGRGFFHVNAHGSAEPCPFSPFTETDLRAHTLLEVLDSPFFRAVRDLNAQDGGHAGGCALFAREAEVRALLAARQARA